MGQHLHNVVSLCKGRIKSETKNISRINFRYMLIIQKQKGGCSEIFDNFDFKEIINEDVLDGAIYMCQEQPKFKLLFQLS